MAGCMYIPTLAVAAVVIVPTAYYLFFRQAFLGEASNGNVERKGSAQREALQA